MAKERTKKTPEQRALENLGTAERVHKKAKDKLAAHQAETAGLVAEVNATQARLQYVALHPDLPQAEAERVAAYLNPEPEVLAAVPDDPEA